MLTNVSASFLAPPFIHQVALLKRVFKSLIMPRMSALPVHDRGSYSLIYVEIEFRRLKDIS